MNWVKINRASLSEKNYVRKADAKTNYWLDLSESKINYYSRLTQGNFNIVIYGDEKIETDYYVVPFKEIRHLLNENSIARSKKRSRWIGNIINHHIALSNTGVKLNISHRYSTSIPSDFPSLIRDDENTDDYAIENAKREINIRLKQSIFRERVLSNFANKCCLTGVSENELLVASHIIPWAVKLDTRLSPHNGLCLSVLYDSLFDKGFFTLSDEGKVIVTSKLGSVSLQLRNWLNEIANKSISPPEKYEISRESLAYHRNTIFDRF